MDYPKDRKENLRFRAKIVSLAINNAKLQNAIWNACKQNILFWINVFCWTYDAKGSIHKELGYSSPHMPFITWGFQDEHILEIVNAIEQGEDRLTEKSRDMGVSWMTIAVFEWFWLFKGPGNDFLIGSRKEELVDKLDDPDTLFAKARYILYRLPVWMRPKGFDRKSNDNFKRLFNPEFGNMMSGEATNKYFGTGGRRKAVLLDEFSKVDYSGESTWRSLSDVTNCKLAVSSANGRANYFYKLRSGLAGEIKVLRLHWKIHPLKDDAWYAEQKTRRSPADLAAEVDIDYQASIVGRAYTSFDYETHCGAEKDWPVWNKNLPIDLLCDFNILPMSWALTHQIKGDDYQFAEMVDQTRTTTADQMMAFCERYKDHKNKTLNVYGDPSGKYGDTRGHSSDYDIIKNIGKANKWTVYVNVAKGHPQHKDRIETANKRLSDWEFEGISHYRVNPKTCPVTVASWEGTQRKGDQIDKSDGIEHITDGITYKWTYLWPINRGFVGSIMR